MVLAYCPKRSHLLLLSEIVPSPIVETEWSAFEGKALMADRIVVVVESLIDWSLFDSMRRLRLRTPGIPWILVTSTSEKNLVELRRFEVEEVVSIAHPDRIATAVRDAKVKYWRAGVARAVQETEGLEGREAEFLVALFLASDPPRTYRQWGKIVHFEEGTIKYHFARCRKRGGPSAALCLNFNLILAGVEAAPWARRWSTVAAMVDVDDRRLKRTARKLLPDQDGRTLGRLVPERDLIAGFLGLVGRSANGAPDG